MASSRRPQLLAERVIAAVARANLALSGADGRMAGSIAGHPGDQAARCILYTYVATQDRFRRPDAARPCKNPPLPHARSAAATADAQRHRAPHPSGTRRGLE